MQVLKFGGRGRVMLIRAALSTVKFQRYMAIFSETFKLLNTLLVLSLEQHQLKDLPATYEAH